MVDQDRTRVLTGAQWKVLAPLIEACRPPRKTEHHDLRRTSEVIIWRHDNGAKWRQIPTGLGPWWMAARCIRRWARLGVWERRLDEAQQRGAVEVEMVFLNGTSIPAANASRFGGRTTRPQARPKGGGEFSAAR